MKNIKMPVRRQTRKGCKPKRPMNAYCIFVKEMRKTKEATNLNFCDFVKFCANKWKNMSESQKYQYKMKAAVDKQRYAKAKKRYVTLPITRFNTQKKPIRSAYLHFCKYERPKLKAKHPDWTLPQITRELAKKWRCTSDEKKLKFKRIVQKEMERYNLRACKELKKEKNDSSDDESNEQ